MNQYNEDFYNFVRTELGDVVVSGYHGKKIRTYVVCWISAKWYTTFSEMMDDITSIDPLHSTYDMDDGSLFVVDRTKQYERIYNHRWNK